MRQHLLNTPVIVFIVLLTACASENEILDEHTTYEPVEPTLVAENHLFGNGEEGIGRTNLVIKTETAWNHLVAKMNTVNNESEQFLVKDIDFSTHQVIAIFDEIRPSGGFSIDLTVIKNNERTVISINYVEPEGLVTDVITQPYRIILLPKSLPDVVFN